MLYADTYLLQNVQLFSHVRERERTGCDLNPLGTESLSVHITSHNYINDHTWLDCTVNSTTRPSQSGEHYQDTIQTRAE